MAQRQVRASLKDNAIQRKLSGRTDAKKEKEASYDAGDVCLQGTTASSFRVGGGTVEVVLSGENLDVEGLVAHILKADKKSPLSDEQVIIEQPQEDDVAYYEFPITVKALEAPKGDHYFAMVKVKDNKGKPIWRVVAVLETDPVTFQ